MVWEPFGGLCSASVAAVTLGRRAFAAETDPEFADLAAERLRRTGARPAWSVAGIADGGGITGGAAEIGAAAVAR